MRAAESIHLRDLVVDLGRFLTPISSEDVHPRLEIDIAPDIKVHGDRAALTQVLLNLMLNARDAMPSGGTLTIAAAHVSNPSERWEHSLGNPVAPGRWIQLEVSDTGLGMDENTLGRIFEPFFTTKVKGHGLGLAAVLGVVTSHRGALTVSSQPGRGTTFYLLLPESTLTTSPPLRDSNRIGDHLRILVVDDEKVMREQMERSLRLQGHHVSMRRADRPASSYWSESALTSSSLISQYQKWTARRRCDCSANAKTRRR
jgi:CheY-like chemotaxis protein